MDVLKYQPVFTDSSVISSRSNQGFPWDLTSRSDTSRTEWSPDLDIYRQDDRFVIEVDLPGVSRDDLSLDLEPGQLTLKGKRTKRTGNDSRNGNEDRPEEESSRTYYRRERSTGAFRRTFSLPDGVDEGSVSARLNNGTLTIEIVRTTPESKTIDVDASPETDEEVETDSFENDQDRGE